MCVCVCLGTLFRCLREQKKNSPRKENGAADYQSPVKIEHRIGGGVLGCETELTYQYV